MQLLKIIFALAILLLIGACTNQDASTIELPQETLEAPSFILDKTLSTSRAEGHICVIISEETFWREGFDEELENHLAENISLVINNELIEYSNLHLEMMDVAYSVIENDEIIGMYGGPISACTVIMGLNVGIHTATIEVKDLSNQAHRYTWEFVVEE